MGGEAIRRELWTEAGIWTAGLGAIINDEKRLIFSEGFLNTVHFSYFAKKQSSLLRSHSLDALRDNSGYSRGALCVCVCA